MVASVESQLRTKSIVISILVISKGSISTGEWAQTQDICKARRRPVVAGHNPWNPGTERSLIVEQVTLKKPSAQKYVDPSYSTTNYFHAKF